MSTKERIRSAALHLFNREGVENVSTRHVAAKLEMSVGNLHYHYSGKNALVKALLTDFLAATDVLARQLAETDIRGFVDYTATVRDTFALVHRYRFFFNDRLTLFRKVPEVEKMFREMVQRRKLEFRELLKRMRAGGLLREDLAAEQYEHLFHQTVILYNSWGSHLSLFAPDLPEDDTAPEAYARMVASMWVPYFSKAGRKQFLNE